MSFTNITTFSTLIMVKFSKVNFDLFAFKLENLNDDGVLMRSYDSLVSIKNSIIYISNNFSFSLFVFYKSSFLLNESIFFSNNFHHESKTIFFCEYCTKIAIHSSKFLFFSSNSDISPFSIFYSVECIFSKNFLIGSIGVKGGAVYLKDSFSIFEANFFINNTAMYGGSIYFESDNLSQKSWILENNTFKDCSAIYGGGAYYWIYSKPELENTNNFIDNRAKTGENFMSQPLYVEIINQQEYNNQKSKYIPSLKINFTFQLKDYYNQSVNDLEEMTEGYLIFHSISNSISKIYDIDGNTLSIFNNSFFNFTDVAFDIEENISFTISFKLGIIKHINPNIYQYANIHSYNKDYYYLLDFNSSECPIGYIFDSKRSLCQMCSAKTFSLNKSDQHCHYCLDNAVCDTNGSFVKLLPGFWRSNYFSLNIHECFNPFSCLGADQCHEYYKGKLCDSCIINETVQFFKLKNGLCKNCEESTISFFMFAGLFILFFIYTMYIIKVNLKEISSNSNNLNTTSVFFKILADYFQIYSCLLNLLEDRKDKLISNLMEYIPNIVDIQGLINPFDCYIFKFGDLRTSPVFKRILMITLFGFISPFLFGFFWILYSYIRSKEFSLKNAKKKVVVSLLIFCYMYQPTLINIYFQSQDCYEIDSNLYMKQDLNEICWGDNHLLFTTRLILPCLFIWMVLLPILLYIIMSKHVQKRKRASLKPGNYFTYFGEVEVKFFKEGFKETFFYWDFILLIKKYFFIVFSIFSFQKFYWNIALLNFLSYFFLFLQSYKKPYVLNIFNKVAFMSHLILYLNSLIILFLILFAHSYEAQEFGIGTSILLNFIFVFFWGFNFWLSKKQDFYDKVKNILKSAEKMKKVLGKKKDFGKDLSGLKFISSEKT